MKTFTHGPILALLCFMAMFPPSSVQGQSILNPSDSVITYNSANPPTQPAWGTIGKWVRTRRVSWNTNNYKCYIYNSYPFRLRYPKSYNPTANDGKKYPILIFFHGEGEGGTMFDNEYSLFHGGQGWDQAVANGTFDGYIFVMQTPNGFWGEPVYTYIMQIMDYMIANNKLDPFRINTNGLSGGGEGCWESLFGHTNYITGSVIMSSSQLSYVSDTSIVKWTPLQLVQGGKDGSPDPGTTQTVVNAIKGAGGNLTYTVFPNDGHNTWDDTWAQPWFYPFLLSTYGSNPWPLFGHSQFCQGLPINATLGLPAGYQAYQWRRNDTIIAGANSNSIVATQFGTYDAQVERNGIWSDWSHTPVVVSVMPTTVTPNITIPPLTSNVIPALDTSKGVSLTVPAGYTSYQWQMLGGGSNLGSNDTLYTRTPGQYEAKVTQQFGCSSTWSNPYTVINANGPNGPSAPTALIATTLTNMSLRLDWNVNPSQPHPQTGFEVYQGLQSGGPYKLVALLGASAVHDTITGLLPGTKYYYVLRAVNGNAGSPASNEATTATYSDTIPPTAPANLIVTSTTRSSVSLQWNASTDNVAVTSYDIYVNGTKSYSTTGTTFTVDNLQYPTSYGLSVVARDFAGNKSPFSNQVTTEPLAAGLAIQYYLLSAPTALPNYNNLAPIATASSTTGVSVAQLGGFTNYGVLWQGWLHVTTAGTYQIRTTSVDGSAVYLGTLNSNALAYNFTGAKTVNNDGVHASKTVTSANLNLSVGIYPIAIVYFHGSTGTGAITLQWSIPGSGGSFVNIPGSAFADANVVQGNAPAAPSGLAANAQSYSSIGLTWTDNSNNETGFEIWRSTDGSNYVTVGTAATGSTTFTDNNLSSNTLYYYQIRAINQYGASGFTTAANATTQALPAIPAAPSGFVSEGTSTTTMVSMSWTNNANNATSIQLYRSTGNNSNYLPLATLSSTATSYIDKGLFDNSVYYYKVRAVNAGGNSAYSNEDSAHTKDRLPVLAAIVSPQYMRYGTTLTLNVAASDSDAATLNIQVTNLPAFGAYTSTGNGTGKITFTPAQTDQGVYNNITVTVTDPFGGQAVDTFSLTVNNDYPPVITRPVSNVTLNEKTTATMLLAATEQNPTDVLNWTFKGMPNFVTITPSVTGDSLALGLAPGYSDGGAYTIQAKVDNGNHLFDTVTFTITVNAVPLPTVNTYIHFDGVPGSNGASPWNNTGTQPAQNVAFSNLKDQNGSNSGISLTITTPWQNISYGTGSNVLGQTTGNNSGVYPDSVLFSGYYTDGTPQNITIAGLDTSTKFNFTFFGSRGSVNDDRTTIYSMSGTYVNQSVSLNAASNTANTVSINNVRPNADGTVTMTLAKGVNAPFGYLNALVVTKQYNDHTAPVAPWNLTGTIVNNTGLSLTWIARAYNANSYQVYRSTNVTGPYTLLNPGATNPTQASYVDTGLVQNTTYYYYATATNSYGVSPGSDTFMIAVPNLAPVLTPVAPITIGGGQTSTTNVTATDAPTDVITLKVTGLGNWANFVDNGNGTGVLTLTPTAANIGSYTGTLTATDNHGASSTTPLNITVTLANLRNVYVHFNDPSAGEPAQGAPWNNTNSAPNAGVAINHLVDDHGATTNFNLTLVNAWTGSNNLGPVTGNNSGVYPDNVEQSFYYDGSGAARVINLTGFSPNAEYNVIFYAGRGGVTDNRITHYSIGNQSVALNAAGNTMNTVQINGVSPDPTGTISISCTQDAGSAWAYINALQIQYSYDTSFSSPAPLTTAGPNTTSIQLTWANNAPAITTGFEIWRGNTPTGPFSLLNTVGNTVTTYTDGGLSVGSSFFYEVRAVAGSRKSAFSNIAGGSTVAYTVRIQCNDGSTLKAQGGTWNSTNTLPFSGFVLSNLINTLGQPTGMNFTIVNNFQGFNSLGTTTGNNSGIFPDNVMQGFYYNDFAQTATLAITGLDYASTYNFNFFSSRQNPQTNVVSTYQIGNQIVTQDATNNTSQTVQIAGVKPDSTGTIYFSIYNTQGGRSYLNALTIDGVPNPIMNYGQTPIATQVTTDAVSGTAARFNNDESLTQAQLTTETSATAFPDPFVDAVSLSLHLPTNVNKLLVTMVDASGRVILRQELDNLPQGTSVVPLGINGSRLPAGTYYLLLQGLPDGKPRSIMLLKMSK